MAEVIEQQTVVESTEKQTLNISTSSSDHGGETNENSPKEMKETKESPVKDEKQKDSEEENQIRKEIEKAMEARRAYIHKECMRAKKRLDLGCSKIDDLDAYTIAMCLSEREPNLELLHVGANLLTSEGLTTILSGLQWHVNLKELYIGNNKFDLEGIDYLIDLLPAFEQLQILSAGNISLGDDQGVSFVSSLVHFKNLKSVMLNSNHLSDKTFVKIATMLMRNEITCPTLHLGDNKPTTTGLVSLFESLEDNKTLKSLYLNDTLFSNDAARALNKMLVKNVCMEYLNTGNCGIDDETISLIKFGLMSNRNLKTLYLWGNRINNEGAYFLKIILEHHNFVLTSMMLSNNNVDEEEILNDIKLLLKRNEKLEKIEGLKDNALALWETIVKMKEQKQESRDNNTKENVTRIEKLEKEVEGAEKKLQDARKELALLKDAFSDN